MKGFEVGAKYTEEKNTLILMSLMKQHGVRKVIASPGTTNVAFVASLQRDPFFEVFSSVDERSAAYMACGMAEESGEPVALSCTQATASRNYFPGLTEAYYRKLPILAVTSTLHRSRIGQNIQQAIDRTEQPVDAVRLSVQIPIVHCADDALYANVSINRALLELKRNGGGPVHINLTTSYSTVYDVESLPESRLICRFGVEDDLPSIPDHAKVAVFVGAHSRWTDGLTEAVDSFCEAYDANVFCDQTSNYWGKYRVNPSLLFSQSRYVSPAEHIDLMIHIGNISGASTTRHAKRVWRVNPDGEIRDTFGGLESVFEMSEGRFFSVYAGMSSKSRSTKNREECWREVVSTASKVPELPLSNAWLAQQTLPRIPKGSVLHLGIYNSLRSWSFFEPSECMYGYSNTGGFGIDGGLSSLVGASLVNEHPCFGVFGDLAFFYDMNSLGNRHVGNNLRILLVNNGCGTEFKNHINRAYELGEEADPFIAAKGHFGSQSKKLVKGYVENLGFEYCAAATKDEFLAVLDRFVSPEPLGRSLVVEVFTSSEDEAEALRILFNIESSVKGDAKAAIRSIVGEKGVRFLKRLVK